MFPTLLTPRAAILLCIPSFITAVSAANGPCFGCGAVPDDGWIREAESTLTVPERPCCVTGILNLWVGMGTTSGDLIQALIESIPGVEWRTRAFTLKPKGEPVQAPNVGIHAGDSVTVRCVSGKLDAYNDETGQYDQSVSVNGEIVSTISTNSGHARGFGSSVECVTQEGTCGPVGAHKWTDTKLVLDKPAPSFKDTYRTILGMETSGFETIDGGKTWVVREADAPAWKFK
ncbi:hypothetical protein Tdes44962_MAKER04766 [Teratosphaeria destructans]|uniref:Uncharacterized protein n=1 Tax=Teratosphaeria destructans TaxID=418781 RepID=A0A9W7SLK1_9PEZI|nr:hypothetical protein Tdes44962_MAKER04766 [Teratosphaeria destructans]